MYVCMYVYENFSLSCVGRLCFETFFGQMVACVCDERKCIVWEQRGPCGFGFSFHSSIYIMECPFLGERRPSDSSNAADTDADDGARLCYDFLCFFRMSWAARSQKLPWTFFFPMNPMSYNKLVFYVAAGCTRMFPPSG